MSNLVPTDFSQVREKSLGTKLVDVKSRFVLVFDLFRLGRCIRST